MTVTDQEAQVSPEIRKTTEPGDRRNAYSTVFMPNGSELCLPHDAPYDLGVAMTAARLEAWAEKENGG